MQDSNILPPKPGEKMSLHLSRQGYFRHQHQHGTTAAAYFFRRAQVYFGFAAPRYSMQKKCGKVPLVKRRRELRQDLFLFFGEFDRLFKIGGLLSKRISEDLSGSKRNNSLLLQTFNCFGSTRIKFCQLSARHIEG